MVDTIFSAPGIQKAAITSKASATITIDGAVGAAQTIAITNTAGTSLTYTAATAEDLTAREFARTSGGAGAIATSLAACITNTTYGHGATISIADSGGGVLTLTQAVAGIAGNTTFVENCR